MFRDPKWGEQYKINASTLEALGTMNETIALLRQELKEVRLLAERTAKGVKGGQE